MIISVSVRARLLRFDPVKLSVDAKEVSQCVFRDATKLPPLRCVKNPVREMCLGHFCSEVYAQV